MAKQWHSPAEGYRLAARRDLHDPRVCAPAHSERIAQPVVTGKKGHRGIRSWPWLEIIISVLSVIGMSVIIAMIAGAAGNVLTILSAFVALIPLVVVAMTLLWLDRWEPEAPQLLWIAFLWGAGVATSLALVSNTTASFVITQISGSSSSATMYLVSIVAPIVEETLKGLGVVVILWYKRRDISSPLDGFVIAGLVGAGFAFTENILYFVESGAALPLTFIMRAVMSPFAHALFTSMTGLAMATGLTRMRGKNSWKRAVCVGWLTAMFLHGFWNGAGSMFFIFIYFFIWVPFFIVWIVMAAVSGTRQRRWIVMGIRPYVEAGWIHDSEAAMIASLQWRRIALRQAKTYGRDAYRAMRRFQRAAASVSLSYVTAVRIGMSEERQENIAHDLHVLTEARRVYVESTK